MMLSCGKIYNFLGLHTVKSTKLYKYWQGTTLVFLYSKQFV